MNKCLFVGNLGAKPELKETDSGFLIGTARLAVNGKPKKLEDGTYETETEWVNIKILGDRAQTFCDILDTGDKVEIEASYHKNVWVTTEGDNRSSVEFIVDRWFKLSPKRDGAVSTPPTSDPGF